MASRRGPSQAKEDDMIIRERLANERARLQAVAEQHRQRIAQAKREREEAAKVAGVASAKVARTGARTPTPPPPLKVVPKSSFLFFTGNDAAIS